MESIVNAVYHASVMNEHRNDQYRLLTVFLWEETGKRDMFIPSCHDLFPSSSQWEGEEGSQPGMLQGGMLEVQ